MSSGMDLSEHEDGLFYGYVCSTVLLGISCMQAWQYFITNEDRWPLRVLVSSLICMDIASTCITSQVLHYYFIEHFGDLKALGHQPFIFNMELMLTIIIVLVVELYFAHKIYLFDHRNKIVPVLVVIFAIASFGIGIGAIVDLSVHPEVQWFGTKRGMLEATMLSATSAIADILITIALSLSLTQSRTGVKRTDTVLHKLVAYTISRGLLVAVAQTLIVVLFPLDVAGQSWMPFHLCMNKLYVITMLAFLNARYNLRKKMNGPVTDTMFNMSLRSTTATPHNLFFHKTESASLTQPGDVYVPERETTTTTTMDIIDPKISV